MHSGTDRGQFNMAVRQLAGVLRLHRDLPTPVHGAANAGQLLEWSCGLSNSMRQKVNGAKRRSESRMSWLRFVADLALFGHDWAYAAMCQESHQAPASYSPALLPARQRRTQSRPRFLRSLISLPSLRCSICFNEPSSQRCTSMAVMRSVATGWRGRMAGSSVSSKKASNQALTDARAVGNIEPPALPSSGIALALTLVGRTCCYAKI
ncbi:hypothetical protein BU16DRAFT_390189 [Lophium mytilinum]|uniref:Uncharacterized protein n=1 Tax=Lophium mytilinum TaxID=390894 RepID=A0A6A6QUN0_9PEZI|nr:hypothetical protein BU16DRAFT_390189 [Lophium mytilinum]